MLQVRLTGSDGQDGEDMKLSVFYVFAELFPEAVGEHGAGGKLCAEVVSQPLPRPAVQLCCRAACCIWAMLLCLARGSPCWAVLQ